MGDVNHIYTGVGDLFCLEEIVLFGGGFHHLNVWSVCIGPDHGRVYLGKCVLVREGQYPIPVEKAVLMYACLRVQHTRT